MIDSTLLIGTHRIVKDLDRKTARICTAYGLTFPQFMVMEALLHKNRMTVGEIKDTILSSNGTIPVIINNLEKTEMVRRVADPTDHRKSLVELTEKGRNLIEKICPENDRMYLERFSVWTSDEKKELVRLIALYENGLKARKENYDENQ